MEPDGAVALFERSIEEQKLLYKTCIGDGDSKAYSAVVNSLPYGGDVFINKEECRAHITKRMGTGLRTLVKNYKGAYCIFGLRISFANQWIGFCVIKVVFFHLFRF